MSKEEERILCPVCMGSGEVFDPVANVAETCGGCAGHKVVTEEMSRSIVSHRITFSPFGDDGPSFEDEDIYDDSDYD